MKNLQVTDPTTNSLRVRWDPAEGDVRTYSVYYSPDNGDAEQGVRSPLTAASGSEPSAVSDVTPGFFTGSQTQVSGMSTSTVLRDLLPDTSYTVTLVPVYTDVQGKRTSADGKTSKTRPHVSGGVGVEAGS